MLRRLNPHPLPFTFKECGHLLKHHAEWLVVVRQDNQHVAFFPLALAFALMLVRSRQSLPLATTELLDRFGVSPGTAVASITSGENPLLPRHRDVLRLLDLGMHNKDIAAALHISEGTVRTHVEEIRRRLGARTRTEAVKEARNRGILH